MWIPCLPLTREVDFCKAKRRRERVKKQWIKGFSLPQSPLVTAPSSEGAKVWAINQLTFKRKIFFFTAPLGRRLMLPLHHSVSLFSWLSSAYLQHWRTSRLNEMLFSAAVLFNRSKRGSVKRIVREIFADLNSLSILNIISTPTTLLWSKITLFI